MLNKGITVRTILLLVIGIIIVGVIVYLVYSTYTDSTLSSTTCMSKVIEWCTACNLKGTAAFTQPCANNNPERCPCIEGRPWVEKCLITVGANQRWNFDQSATNYRLYQDRPWEYCQRVGVD